MSWASLPAEVQEIAEQVLTQKQLEAFKLELAGLGTRAIAHSLSASRESIRDRLRAAARRLHDAGVHQDASGHWHIDEEVAA